MMLIPGLQAKLKEGRTMIVAAVVRLDVFGVRPVEECVAGI